MSSCGSLGVAKQRTGARHVLAAGAMDARTAWRTICREHAKLERDAASNKGVDITQCFPLDYSLCVVAAADAVAVAN